MKKLIITAAIVLAAVASQAAAVAWSITSVTDSPSTAKAAGWVAYFMDGSTYSAFSALTADKVAEYAAGNYTYTANTVKAARGGAVSASGSNGNYTAGDEVSAYIVLFNAADATAADYYAVTSVMNTTVPSVGSTFSMAYNFETATSGWQTTAVPEPTSGLLMLLGMAGLALRRRRA